MYCGAPINTVAAGPETQYIPALSSTGEPVFAQSAPKQQQFRER
jgi:hypothetical protein